eukprot:14667693-Alexandrium_andersonii.AAC.1
MGSCVLLHPGNGLISEGLDSIQNDLACVRVNRKPPLVMNQTRKTHSLPEPSCVPQHPSGCEA